MLVSDWLLTATERGNPHTRIDDVHPGDEAWSAGNTLRPLVHGRDYFAELQERISPLVIVDLDRVEFIDSSGLGALVRARRKAQEHGGDVVLAGADEQVSDVLSLTNLSELVAVYDSVAEAVAALPDSPAARR